MNGRNHVIAAISIVVTVGVSCHSPERGVGPTTGFAVTGVLLVSGRVARDGGAPLDSFRVVGVVPDGAGG